MSEEGLFVIGFLAGLLWIPMFIWMFLMPKTPVKQTLSEESLDLLIWEAVNNGATDEEYARHIENISTELNINGIKTREE